MEKVLIIEDLQAFSLMLATLIAEKYGFEADIAPTLADAAKLLNVGSEEYFVAIVDLNLPDGDRGDSLDLVKKYNVPGLVFTGEISDSLREDLIHKGAADYVLKDGNHNIDYIVNMVNRVYLNRSIKILVVDDSQSARDVMKHMLQLQRYQVVTAKSASEAEDLLVDGCDIQLAIIDCQMDEMDGIQLTGNLRRRFDPFTLPIIGVSGKGTRAYSSQFIKHGANDFIIKPFDQEEFLSRVNQVIYAVESARNLELLNQQKNDLIAVAAHDIRNPLNIIKNAAKLIPKTQDAERLTSLVGMIDKNASDTVMLVDDMLCVAAIESGGLNIQLSPSQLDRIVNEAVDYHRLRAEQKQQQLSLSINRLPELDFDSVRIRQVIDNLVSNAIKYAPVESCIDIAASYDDHHQYFEVTDQGPGIPAEKQEHLYEPYYTFGNKATGGESSTGLGLSICKSIITAHGGRLKYSNPVKGGSCFRFELPYSRVSH